MKPELSASLKSIYELEIALGNTIEGFNEPTHSGLPVTVVFTRPLHRAQIESTLTLASPVKWYSVSRFAGYVDEKSRQTLQGPSPGIPELARHAEQKLPNQLRQIYDLELSLGNAVARVDEPAGSRCPLAIVFEKPLHRREIESQLTEASMVRWWENRDPHYPLEGSYQCDDTGSVVAGPLS